MSSWESAQETAWDTAARAHAGASRQLNAATENWGHQPPLRKCELCCMISLLCCFVGALATFPLATNLALALLGLMCCRHDGSEVQRIGYCFFTALSFVTDIIFMCSWPNGWGWGGVMAIANMPVKVVAAMQIFALSETFGTGPPPQSGALHVEHGDEEPGMQAESAMRPLARADYHALAAEAVQRHTAGGDVGENTNYRAI